MMVKWSTICAKIKSANPRSGLISLNCALFCGFACNRKHTETEILKQLESYLNFDINNH